MYACNNLSIQYVQRRVCIRWCPPPCHVKRGRPTPRRRVQVEEEALLIAIFLGVANTALTSKKPLRHIIKLVQDKSKTVVSPYEIREKTMKTISRSNPSRKLFINQATGATARYKKEVSSDDVPNLTVDTEESSKNMHHHCASAAPPRGRTSSQDSLNSSDWLSPSLLHLTNRVMTRLAEISSSTSPTAMSGKRDAGKLPNDVASAGWKTTGLFYNRSVDEEERPQESGIRSKHDVEMGDERSSSRKGHAKRLTQDELLMTQQLSGFQAETDEVLRSIASSLLTNSKSSKAHTPFVPSETAAAFLSSSMTKDASVVHDNGEGYDTDDDGLEKELAQLHSVAEQLRHDLDGASSFLPAVIGDGDEEDSEGAGLGTEDVAQMSKHLKSWGLLPQDGGDTMLVSSENSMLVIFSFVLAVVWFLNRNSSSADDGHGHNWIL